MMEMRTATWQLPMALLVVAVSVAVMRTTAGMTFASNLALPKKAKQQQYEWK